MTIACEHKDSDVEQSSAVDNSGKSAADKAAAAAATALEHAVAQWLGPHCQTLPGVSRAIALIVEPLTQSYKVVATWPGDFTPPRAMIAMADIAFSGRSDAKRINSDAGPIDRVTLPINKDGKLLGALVVEADGLTYRQRRALLTQIHGNPPARTSPEEAIGFRLAIVLELLATCLDVKNAQPAAMAFVTELATRTGCDRVSYGRCKRNAAMHVVAMSNNARIARRSNLVRSIESAMDEAADQGQTIVFPRNSSVAIADREHVHLSRSQGDAQVLTVPLLHDGQSIGALTLERHGATAFDEGIIELCESLAAVAGPVLELKHRDDRSVFAKVADSAKQFAGACVGPRYPGLKVCAIAVAILLSWLVFATGTYRLTATAKLEGSISRAVVAPQDGFVASAHARAGDAVSAGTLLSQLDDSDLQLELSKWRSESGQLQKQYRGALASHDRAETTILRARIARADAQIKLLTGQLGRTELRAPFDGLVVAGDLSQLLGSPVQRGDILFEIAPLDDYRVVLEVDERDMAQLATGQSGQLVLKGLPGQTLTVIVDKITPVATPRDGRNFFRVEGHLDSAVEALRPGMAGIAKIDAGSRRLLWIWTHRIVDWVNLRLWTWLP